MLQIYTFLYVKQFVRKFFIKNILLLFTMILLIIIALQSTLHSSLFFCF